MLKIINKLTIINIDHGSNAYWEAVKIRNQILREPLNMCLSKAQIDAEIDSSYIHMVASLSDRIVGVLVLKNHGDFFQVFHIAVLNAEQRKGIGRELLLKAESFLIEKNNCGIIMVLSRQESIGFYSKLGYQTTNYECIIVGLPHRQMKKRYST